LTRRRSSGPARLAITASLAAAWPEQILTAATSAVREAPNAASFCDGPEPHGLEVDSGQRSEEARGLIYLGVLSGMASVHTGPS